MMSGERLITGASGWVMLTVTLALLVGGPAVVLTGFGVGSLWVGLSGLALFLTGLVLVRGHFINQPNQARVVTLFGRYVGTVRENGFRWVNPFTQRKQVSMVQDALQQLVAENIVELDEERNAAMVSNLMVVLTADRSAQPVVNAGTLYPG